MKLELDILNIQDVRFGEKTTVNDGVLFINKEGLKTLLAKDKRFSKVDIDVAQPGESCRLAQVFDLVEPRTKAAGTGENFPGILSKIRTTGVGRTRVLRGTAVVTIGYQIGPRGMVVDMSGLGAEMGIYSRLQNIALLCYPTDGLSRPDYQNALRLAGLKAAVYLAEAGQEIKADEVEVYNLGSLDEVSNGMEHLPRVAYIYQIHALQQGVVPNEPIFYGDNASKLLPTIVHPNEILDGAIVRNYWCRGHETYSIQNHPIILELYKRHGKDLCFAGVVITTAYATELERERAAVLAAKLVKWVLGADGVILTKTGGGAPHIDLAQTCDACEELGVKTTLIVQDESKGESSDTALLFSTKHADAIVNVGSYDGLITLPAVERVIGGPVIIDNNGPADGEIVVPVYTLSGAMNQIGASKLMVREV